MYECICNNNNCNEINYYHPECSRFYHQIYPVVRFGKHKGKTLDWIKTNNPSYIRWFTNSVKDSGDIYKINIMNRGDCIY